MAHPQPLISEKHVYLVNNKNIKPKAVGKAITLVIPRWLYCYLPLIFAAVSIFASWAITTRSKYLLEQTLEEKVGLLGWKAVDLFLTYDKDGDLQLSLDEAAQLLLLVTGQDNETETADVLPDEDFVTIQARFIPLNISTMTRSWDPVLGVANDSFSGLFSWLSPAFTVKEFGVSKFLDLLPLDLRNLPPPGTVYTITPVKTSNYLEPQMPSNRYYPPRVKDRGLFVHRLLSMFHPRPFLIMRSDPQGIVGCVRAYNEKFIEVFFRMHVEFQLNEPPLLPFWFTPSQFTGRLHVARDLSSVKYFDLYVPNNRRLNVDMEWLTDKDDPENMEVDIGYMPLMELKLVNPGTEDFHDGTALPPLTKWDAEISEEEANKALELRMFPFKQIKYYNLSEVVDQALSENKLIHTILLWGALDDQSC